MSITKDDNAKLDYGLDWAPWLAPYSDEIATSEWFVPPGLSVFSDSKTATRTTVWLTGGIIGESYAVINRITTVGGRIDERTLYFFVDQR